MSRARSDYSFDGEKTFLIAGGLGGLGRSIARWLVRRGARNLMLLSRSGPDGNDEALAMLKDLREMRILVECPICDITDVGSLQSVLQQYSKIMPPIKGCFQASMVLRVSHISFYPSRNTHSLRSLRRTPLSHECPTKTGPRA